MNKDTAPVLVRARCVEVSSLICTARGAARSFARMTVEGNLART